MHRIVATENRLPECKKLNPKEAALYQMNVSELRDNKAKFWRRILFQDYTLYINIAFRCLGKKYITKG